MGRRKKSVLANKVEPNEKHHVGSICKKDHGKSKSKPKQGRRNSPSIHPETIKGVDDNGKFYDSQHDLMETQEMNRSKFYKANELYWTTGGYGGLTDDEAMIGDSDGNEDGAEGLEFLDRYVTACAPPGPSSNAEGCRLRFDHALDVGAGVGRISKLVLLKRYDQVRLLEGDPGWSKRSKVYLGRKRASRCTFINQRLEQVTPHQVLDWYPMKKVDLMWVQWTLQYLTDGDVVTLLQNLSQGLRPKSGVIVVKENRPFGNAREDRFQMEVPGGSNENDRYDITRPDKHHRLLFEKAGLYVEFVEKGAETNSYVLAVS